MRKKWDENRGSSTYGEQTIAKAIKGCRSVYSPAKYMSRVEEVVSAAMEIVLGDAWRGRSGPTDRDVYKALIYTVGKYGHIEADDTVTVRASTRDLALAAGIRKLKSIRESLKRLENLGLIRKLENGRGKKASKYTLVLTQTVPITNNRVNTYGYPSSQTVDTAQKGNITTTRVNTYVPVSRALTKIRNSSPNYGTIGKKNARIIEHVATSGRVVMLDEIAKLLKARKNNLMARNIPLLLELDFLEVKDGGYVTPHDLEERLEEEFRVSGQKEAADMQKASYERQRKAQRDRQRAYKTVFIKGNLTWCYSLDIAKMVIYMLKVVLYTYQNSTKKPSVRKEL